MKRRGLYAAVATAGVCLAGVPAQADPGGSASKATPSKAKVAVVDFSFKPSTTKVRKGGKVTWAFKEGLHNVTGKDGLKSGNRSSGTYKHKFKSVGTFKYRCTIHPDMKGVVRVVKK